MVERGALRILRFAFCFGFLRLLLPDEFFFPEASTMEEVRTSPNKKSDNEPHWKRILGRMDGSGRGTRADANETLEHSKMITNQTGANINI